MHYATTFIILLNSYLREQELLEQMVKEKYLEARPHLSCKKQLFPLKAEKGKPESLIMANIELT